ncbi:MAG: efflux RND transporter periplasmic adaptor subunit, partial [Planctomycetota bacterium]
ASSGTAAWRARKRAEAEEDRPSDATLVELARPRRGAVRESITLSGDLRALHSIDITSRVSGVVTRVAVQEGDRVSRGDLLIQLDDRELSLSSREQEVAHRDAVERQRSSKIEVSEARHNRDVMKIARDRAEKEFSRYEELLTETAPRPFSEEEFESKRFAFQQARISHEQAALAAERVEVQDSMAALSVERAKLAWDRALLDLSRAEIRSPIAGEVSFLEVRPGEMVQSGMRVAAVVNRERLYTEVRVPQRRMRELEIGQSVEIGVEIYPELTFGGAIEMIHPTVDPEGGTVKVRVAVEDPRSLLRPGIYVTATIILAVREQALLLPKRARIFEGKSSMVFVARDGKAVRIPVTPGQQTEEEFEVRGAERAGISEDDLVVVRGQTRLKDGDPVRLTTSLPDGEETSTAEDARGGEESPVPGQG